MYVCGPTVYDHPHIGNARPAVVFDVLYRLLKTLYPKVTYVRNFTDVDDKINARAREEGVPIAELTRRMTQIYLDDMSQLNVLRPDVEPRATAHVAEMIALIERLIGNGHAYAADGHVLFHVPSWADYGRFARRSTDELMAGARVEVAPYKRDAMDFVLWKPSDAKTPGWDSPWGRGRPGWHIECSAMAKQYLGATFDIHGGGQDLIFPHHQNEVAQSVCAHDGAPLANYWVHNGFVIVEGEKMSKSLGNFFTMHDLLAEFPGEAIRLALLQTHYRQPLDFTKEGLRQAKRILDRWYRLVGDDLRTDDVPSEVQAALEDDLNTPKAISEMHKIADARHLEGIVNHGSPLGGYMLGRMSKQDLVKPMTSPGRRLRAAANSIGLLTLRESQWFGREQSDSLVLTDSVAIEVFRWVEDPRNIEKRINERNEARRAQNFKLADEIRDELATYGIVLEDGPKGTTWRRAG